MKALASFAFVEGSCWIWYNLLKLLKINAEQSSVIIDENSSYKPFGQQQYRFFRQELVSSKNVEKGVLSVVNKIINSKGSPAGYTTADEPL